MTDAEREFERLAQQWAAFLERQIERLQGGEIRVVKSTGEDNSAATLAAYEEQLRDCRAWATVLANRTAIDPGDFMIDDVMRQAAAIRRSGDEPVRVRMSPLDWGKMQRSPNALHMLTLGPPPTVSGINIVFDEDWDGPVTVEGLSNTPVRPSKDGQ